MRNLVWIGIVLIVLGVGGLAIGHFSYTEDEKVLKAGPLEDTAEKEHHFPIPTAAGVVVVIAGVALVLAGRRSA